MLAGYCSSYLASSQPHFPFRYLSYQCNASIHITGEGSVLAIEPNKTEQYSIKGVYIICFSGNSHYWACLHVYEMEVGILICQTIRHYSNGVADLQGTSLNLPYYTIYGQLQSVTIRFYMYLFYYVLASLNMLRL